MAAAGVLPVVSISWLLLHLKKCKLGWSEEREACVGWQLRLWMQLGSQCGLFRDRGVSGDCYCLGVWGY